MSRVTEGFLAESTKDHLDHEIISLSVTLMHTKSILETSFNLIHTYYCLFITAMSSAVSATMSYKGMYNPEQ